MTIIHNKILRWKDRQLGYRVAFKLQLPSDVQDVASAFKDFCGIENKADFSSLVSDIVG